MTYDHGRRIDDAAVGVVAAAADAAVSCQPSTNIFGEQALISTKQIIRPSCLTLFNEMLLEPTRVVLNSFPATVAMTVVAAAAGD